MTLQAGGSQHVPPEQHKDNPNEQLKAARDKIRQAYEAKRIDFGNSNSQSTNKGFEMQLDQPVNAVEWKWKAAREKILSDESGDKETRLLMLQNEHKERLEKIVKLVELYIQNVAAKHGGWLDAAAMAEITASINYSAGLYTHLLIHGNPKIFKVIEVVMGGTAEGGSHSEELEKTLPVMAEMATHEMNRGDRGIMSCIWVLANFLPRPQRIKFCTLYAQGKTEREVDEFLRYGNSRGVLSADEMEAVMVDYTKNSNFKFADHKALTETWAQVNDLQQKIKQLEKGVYGSQNDAGRMLTFKNILITTGQLIAGATIGGNLLFGMWKGGALKSPRDMVLNVLNPVNLLAGGAFKALGMARSDERIDKALVGDETSANNRRKEAIQILSREKRGNVLWDNWEAFFASNGKGQRDFTGAKVFYDFIADAKKRAKSDDLPEGEMSTSKFLDYLQQQANSKQPHDKEVDYKGLLEQFSQISPPTILPFAKAFDVLAIGGVNAKQNFENAMKQTEQV